MTARVGFLADDLTGATDVLAQAHALGLEAVLVMHPAAATADLAGTADVVGIAAPIRSLEGDALDAAVGSGFAALVALRPATLLYKVCSTFDSSPTTGSIGRALRRLHSALPGHGAVPVAPAQPGFGRYTAFSQHFGAHAGEVHRLDRHPVMSVHPSTPMHEADLRRVLAEQLDGDEVPGLHLPAFSDGTFDEQWQRLRTGDGAAFVVDAVLDEHLDRVASAVTAGRPGGPSLVVGSGGMMAALARVLGGTTAAASPAGRASGPTLVVSASASAVTAGQIGDAVARGWEEVPLDPRHDEPPADVVDRVGAALGAGRDVVAHTVRGPDDPRLRADPRPDAGQVGRTIGLLAAEQVRRGLTRDVVVCGGDTSGHALAALDVRELRVTAPLATAGPVCRADDRSVLGGCRLLLKGGQVGPPDLFARFAGHPTPT